MSMCRVISCVTGRECLLWPVCSLGETLLAFALLHFVPQCQTWYLLTSYFCIPVPYNEKNIFFLVLGLEGLVGLHRTGQLHLLQHQWLGHRLGLLWSTTPWIWSTIAFWILVKPLHRISVCSKSMQLTENYNTCSQHWSTERAQFFPMTMLDCMQYK